MSKSLLFYTIDECTDVDKYCKNKGLRPYKYEKKTLDNRPFEQVVQYIKDGFVYDVLEWDRCYSGYMVTLMRQPKLSYKELLNVALTSKYFDERVGAVGIILKEHPTEFEQYLFEISKDNIKNSPEKIQFKKVAKLINDFIKVNTSYVLSLEKILLLCENLRL